jgi:glycine/D-amino acid oxidase-like deaminating enzyme
VRAGIVGGGLAGSLLAWRLAHATTDWDIDLIPGERCGADATTASGGAVRAYERDPEQRRLAIASMVELLGSRTLRQWADYRQVGSVYLRPGSDGFAAEVAELERALPGSVQLGSAAQLRTLGWAGVPPDAVAVLERCAGYTAPGRLREAILADGAVRRRLSVRPGAVGTVTLDDNGTITCDRRGYDLVVLAIGAWTGPFLRANGLPADGHRTKSIQYATYPTGAWRPPHFVDEFTGLYGRPTADGGLLLGLPTDQWGVDPDHPPTTPSLHDEAARLARARFPKLRIGPATRRVGSTDCYADQPGLALRPVVPTPHRLFTFSGGAGASVKTALAASYRAAVQLVESDQRAEATSTGRRKGQP